MPITRRELAFVVPESGAFLESRLSRFVACDRIADSGYSLPCCVFQQRPRAPMTPTPPNSSPSALAPICPKRLLIPVSSARVCSRRQARRLSCKRSRRHWNSVSLVVQRRCIPRQRPREPSKSHLSRPQPQKVRTGRINPSGGINRSRRPPTRSVPPIVPAERLKMSLPFPIRLTPPQGQIARRTTTRAIRRNPEPHTGRTLIRPRFAAEKPPTPANVVIWPHADVH